MTLAVKDTRDGIQLTEDALEDVFASVIAQAEAARDGARETLTPEDMSNLATVLGYEVSENTRKNYRSQWRLFLGWASNRRISALPADPVQVAAYLAERLVKHGHRPATLQASAAALGFVHRNEGFADPCEATEVRNVLRSARRMAGSEQKQAKGITDDDLKAIAESACIPRRWSDGRTESVEVAERRGKKDIAMISVMRDGLLRVSEASVVTWADIQEDEDGTGRLYIGRSKTDAEGEGAVVFLSVQTMESLDAVRGMSSGEGSVFGLRPNGISTRIRDAAWAAGLGEGYSGHSPRVGMARDLARAGTELPRLMTAGRWRSPRMPALYTRNETVSRGAVAQYYGTRRRRTVRPTPGDWKDFEVKTEDDPCPVKVAAGARGVFAQFDEGECHLHELEGNAKMPFASNLRAIIETLPMAEDSSIKALIHAVFPGAAPLLDFLLATPSPRAIACI